MPLKLEHVELLVFDLDDTLYPERQFSAGGLREVADFLAENFNLSAEQLFDQMLQLFETDQRGSIFQTVLEKHAISSSIDQLVDLHRSHKPQLTLFDDARRALERYRRHYKLAILTDGYLQVQSNKTAALGLEKLVDQIVYTDKWGRQAWKPSEQGFVFLQQQFTMSGRQCVYIADNATKDFIAPNRLGWQTIIIKRPDNLYKYRQELVPAGGQPGHAITNLDELEL